MANTTTKEDIGTKYNFSLFSKIKSSIIELFRKPGIEKVYDEFDLEIRRLQDTRGKIEREMTKLRRWNQILMNEETNENSLSIVSKGKRKGLMETFNRKWIALRIAITLYRTLLPSTNQHITRFRTEMSNSISTISQYDPKLARKIAVLSLQENEASPILAPISGIMGNTKLVVDYIKTHYEEMMRAIDRIKDTKLAAKLRRDIVILSDREIKEINKCINDVRNWQYRIINDKKIGSFVGKYNIPFNIYLIIERSHLFVVGGVSRYDGDKFLGFNSHFKDEELVNRIRSATKIRNLSNFVEELKFFDEKSKAIRISVQTEGNWEGFEQFYNNLRKGENYIGVVRNKFGNEKFAKLLETFEKEKHEAPLDWEKELEMLGEEIRRSYYYVVSSAENTFLQIFDETINQLELKKQSAMAELAAILAKSDNMTKIRGRFLRLLGERRNQLNNELENERRVFDNVISGFVLFMPRLDSELAKIVAIADTGNAPSAEIKILKFAESTRRFTLAQTRAYTDDIVALKGGESTTRALASSMAGTYGSLRAAMAEAKLQQNVEIRHIDGIIAIKKLMNLIENQMNPLIAKCSIYINSRLKDYVKEVNDYIDEHGDAQKQIKETQFPQIREAGTRQSSNTSPSARILKFNKQKNYNKTKLQFRDAA